jgi:2-isopropylmalate synthase
MKPLSGWNARAHSSGIHQQGLSQDNETYSLPLLEKTYLAPERIVLSRHSGQAGVALFARRYCGLDMETEALVHAAALVKSSPGPSVGLTEFILILSELKALPAGYPGPLVIRTFSQSLREDGWTTGTPAFRLEVSLGLYGKEEAGEQYYLEGVGESESAAVLAALSALPFPAPALEKTALNGFGGRIRLYAEIYAGGRLYAVERTGTAPGRLLFECCLDAVNGEILAGIEPGKK